MLVPHTVIFEKGSLEYPLGKKLYEDFKNHKDIKIMQLPTNRVGSAIEGESKYEKYRFGKKTLVVGIKKSLSFQSCKPSAHYQLPLVSGCMGGCEYCYLNTQLGDKPFTRLFVNTDEILSRAKKYIEERSPEITIFEGAATSDPVPVEPYTNALRQAIVFFSNQPNARFRFVTKYNDIDSLLDAEHNGNTEIRFSLNTSRIIREYEHYTASAEKRIESAAKLAEAGYPIGFIIAPVILYENWQQEYRQLLEMLATTLPKNLSAPVGFEIISHRYTAKAKNIILEVFPQTTLPMTEDERKFQYGQFGYGKYVYPKEKLQTLKDFFTEELSRYFPNKDVKYII